MFCHIRIFFWSVRNLMQGHDDLIDVLRSAFFLGKIIKALEW